MLEELSQDSGDLQRALQPTQEAAIISAEAMKEPVFRHALNDNEMANDKLADGIRLFARDQELLEEMLKSKM